MLIGQRSLCPTILQRAHQNHLGQSERVGQPLTHMILRLGLAPRTRIQKSESGHQAG